MTTIQQKKEHIKNRLHSFLVHELKEFLRVLHKPISGRKTELTLRIKASIDECSDDMFSNLLTTMRSQLQQRIPSLFHNTPEDPPSASVAAAAARTPISFNPLARQDTKHVFTSPKTQIRIAAQLNRPAPVDYNSITFEASPFYDIIEKLSDTKKTEYGFARLIFQFSDETAEKLKTGEVRLMLFACKDQAIKNSALCPPKVDLPRPVRYRLNSKELQQPAFGKRKPAYQSALDLSKICANLYSGVANALEIQMVGPPVGPPIETFVFRVQLVRCFPMEEVLEKIRKRQNLSKIAMSYLERQLADRSAYQNDDLMAVTTEMSLQCPVGLTRIAVPMKAATCRHQQCFDGVNFLNMNERSPSWTCPICSKAAPFDHLIVDGNFENILAAVSNDVNMVILGPDGGWTLPTTNSSSSGYSKIKPEPGDMNDIHMDSPATISSPRKPICDTISLLSDSEDEDTAPSSSARRDNLLNNASSSPSSSSSPALSSSSASSSLLNSLLSLPGYLYQSTRSVSPSPLAESHGVVSNTNSNTNTDHLHSNSIINSNTNSFSLNRSNSAPPAPTSSSSLRLSLPSFAVSSSASSSSSSSPSVTQRARSFMTANQHLSVATANDLLEEDIPGVPRRSIPSVSLKAISPPQRKRRNSVPTPSERPLKIRIQAFPAQNNNNNNDHDEEDEDEDEEDDDDDETRRRGYSSSSDSKQSADDDSDDEREEQDEEEEQHFDATRRTRTPELIVLD